MNYNDKKWLAESGLQEEYERLYHLSYSGMPLVLVALMTDGNLDRDEAVIAYLRQQEIPNLKRNVNTLEAENAALRTERDGLAAQLDALKRRALVPGGLDATVAGTGEGER